MTSLSRIVSETARGYLATEALAQLKLCAALLSEHYANHYGKTTEPWLAKFAARIKAADAVIKKVEGV